MFETDSTTKDREIIIKGKTYIITGLDYDEHGWNALIEPSGYDDHYDKK